MRELSARGRVLASDDGDEVKREESARTMPCSADENLLRGRRSARGRVLASDDGDEVKREESSADEVMLRGRRHAPRTMSCSADDVMPR